MKKYHFLTQKRRIPQITCYCSSLYGYDTDSQNTFLPPRP
jgi:hypothetical protein